MKKLNEIDFIPVKGKGEILKVNELLSRMGQCLFKTKDDENDFFQFHYDKNIAYYIRNKHDGNWEIGANDILAHRMGLIDDLENMMKDGIKYKTPSMDVNVTDYNESRKLEDIINEMLLYVRHNKDSPIKNINIEFNVNDEDKNNSDIKDAMKIVTNAIKNDPEYRQNWQANIAMAMYDEMEKNNKLYLQNSVYHKVANKAADRFLDLLCG